MRNGGTIVLFGLIALLLSWGAMVVAPVSQLGQLSPHLDEVSGSLYPLDRPGMAKKGAEVYRSLGCAECHTRYATQNNLRYGAQLIKVTDTNAAAKAITAVRPDLTLEQAKILASSELPAQILENAGHVEVERAKALIEATLTNKVSFTVNNNGQDIERGWGVRQTVSRDYIYDNALALGTLRVGPDLANIGSRDPKNFVGAWSHVAAATNTVGRLNERRQWHLAHLYHPQSKSPRSSMPSYKFLFKEVDAGLHKGPSVELPSGFAPAGKVVVPTVQANALVEWMLSQKPDQNLPEMPVQPML